MNLNTSFDIQTINRTSQPSCWYAIYTRPHHEKNIYRQLQHQHVEAYLPLQTTLKQWSDRKKKVTEPLFSCYLFVHVTVKEYFNVLNISGVVRYITFEGKPLPISEDQIQLIKNILEQDIETMETAENILNGDRVEIVDGPLRGIIGKMTEYANKKRVILRIEEINKVLLVNVPLNLLKLVN